MSSWHEPNQDPLGNTRLHFAVAGLALAGLVAGLAAVSGWDAAPKAPNHDTQPTIVCEARK